MSRCRQTAKMVKFELPEDLKDYDIIVWMDSKKLRKVTYSNICALFEKYPKYDIINFKHPTRSSIQEELKCTIRHQLENRTSGLQFLDKIKDFKSDFNLPDTCVIVRRNTAAVNEAFRKCYQILNEFNLKRDQNVYNFALHGLSVPLLLPSVEKVLGS
jgi:hypothetical protein